MLQPKLPRHHPFYAFTDWRALLVCTLCMSLVLSVAAALGSNEEPVRPDVKQIFLRPQNLAP